MANVYYYGDVQVTTDGIVMTPMGSARVLDSEFIYDGCTPVVASRSAWSPGMVVFAIIAGLLSCGLGLILLFLARTQQVVTVGVDSVRIVAPRFVYIAQAPGGAHFVSWVVTLQSYLSEREPLAIAEPADGAQWDGDVQEPGSGGASDDAPMDGEWPPGRYSPTQGTAGADDATVVERFPRQ